MHASINQASAANRPTDGTSVDAAFNAVDLNIPLVVDLDGTLIASDTLWEGLLTVAKTRPWSLFPLFFAIFAGKAAFKAAVSREALLPVENLPYRPGLVQVLRAERDRGRELILASGATDAIAKAVSEHLGLFSSVQGSPSDRNNTGTSKLEALRAKLGERQFLYAGDSKVDLPLWRASAGAILVNVSAAVRRTVAASGTPVLFEIPSNSRPFKTVVRALRVHQWIKNVLVLLPIVMAHRFTDPIALAQGAIAFFAFSFTASTLYLLNDMLDIEADRRHPTKRKRPFASGDLSIARGGALVVFSALIAVLLAAQLNPLSRWLLAAYALTTMLYSFRLKTYLMADVICLSMFYTVRLLFGGAATGIQISIWALAFSVFVFTALALIKRVTELATFANQESKAISRRGYYVGDLPIISAQAAGSTFVAVLVIALYIQSDDVQRLYRHPQYLWAICPALLYFLNRMLVLAHRGYLDADPIVFATRDRACLVTVLAMFAAALMAAYS